MYKTKFVVYQGTRNQPMYQGIREYLPARRRNRHQIYGGDEADGVFDYVMYQRHEEEINWLKQRKEEVASYVKQFLVEQNRKTIYEGKQKDILC